MPRPRKGPLTSATAIERARVRDLFLRLLGLTFLIAFLSLLVQVRLLFGSRGLLPAQDFLEAVRPRVGFLDIPTLFWWTGAADAVLVAAAILGILASVLLVASVAPRAVLVALWFLYLSFASIGQDFLSFQWDNLILESAFLALFIAPPGVRPRGGASPPHPIGIFLMLWLVFRLHVESGLAKLLTGDPTWRDLSAMATYYETAPIPTWVGWYVHQMPLWVHKACSLFTFVVEIGVPALIWVRSRAVRSAVFLLFIAMQISIVLTANYGFFNYLSMALCLFVLDDGHLAWLGRAARRLRGLFARGSPSSEADREAAPADVERSRPPANAAAAPAPAHTSAGARRRRGSRARDALLIALAIAIVPLSIVPFVRFFRAPALSRAVEPVWHVLSNWRSLNAYHLFASMTLVRREAIIEGSDDGETWSAYEFRYKPGDPDRAPPFVAPHQPRVDFQLWFLLLGGRPSAPYFNTLLVRLLEEPAVVAPLFSDDPFPETQPRMLRVSSYRYTFTSPDERRATGAWWNRALERTTAPFGAADLNRLQ